MRETVPQVAIVDYGMGNLFSVGRACEAAGMSATITSTAADIERADAVILPGVGAFGDAMATLRRLGLVSVLRETAASGKPLVGICLGMQLLATESREFGRHEGLGIIPGVAVRFDHPTSGTRRLKVPQVGWNRIYRVPGRADSWAGSPLASLPEGLFIYFVHSYYVRLDNANADIAVARYGDVQYCAALKQGNVFACQGHPERSGPLGLAMYRNLAASLCGGTTGCS